MEERSMKNRGRPAALLLCLLLLCGCAAQQTPEVPDPMPLPEVVPEVVPEPAPEPVPEPAPEPVPDRFAALGIPEEVGDAYYTESVRETMLQQGLDYATVEQLLDGGYQFSEMVEMTPEQRRVCSFAQRYGHFEGGAAELLATLPQTEAYILGTWGDRVQKATYGTSRLGRSLDAYVLCAVEEPRQTVMLTFALHGYEGAERHDGAYLTDSAYMLMQFYAMNPEFLGETRLVLCPMVNPDGVYAEKSDGYGREQADGIDLNRDFDADGFRAAESVALRELIARIKPNILIDFHGWLNATYGDTKLARIFDKHTGLYHWTTNYGASLGYLVGYAHEQGIRALLVEHTHFTEMHPKGLLYAVNQICKGI